MFGFGFTLTGTRRGAGIAAPPTLAVLALDTVTLDDSMAPGAIVAAVLNRTSGSSIVMSGAAFAANKLAYSAGNIVVGSAGPLTASSTTGTFTLTETLAGAIGSPKANAFASITVTAAASGTPGALDFSDPNNSALI